MSRDRKSSDGQQGGPDVRALAALKTRAVIKLWLVTIMVTELLSAIFSYVADRLDTDMSSLPTLVFTFATSALVSRWLVADASRAWSYARKSGFVRREEQDGHSTITVTQDCPKRWLVMLHAGLTPNLTVNA
ncbi:MAG TPA: hypothetical protein VGG24_05560 [Paraburkholderia sp.]|jgi:hypothetical protein